MVVWVLEEQRRVVVVVGQVLWTGERILEISLVDLRLECTAVLGLFRFWETVFCRMIVVFWDLCH